MTLTGVNRIPEEQGHLTGLISEARDALEWLAEMEELSEDLHEKARDVEVETSKRSGQFVAVTIKAFYSGDHPPKQASRVMGDYDWDESSLSQEDGDWRLRVRRRYTIT